jgi:hypothetical protein
MPKEKNKGDKKERSFSKDELIQVATKAGLKSLISQPGLQNYALLISNNIDNKKISYFVQGIEKEFKEKNIPAEQHDELLYNNLVNYIAGGHVLKDTAQQTIFDKSEMHRGVLEKIVGFFKPHKFEGEKYFEKARNAYGDMYNILAQDEIAQKEMPDLTKAAQTLRMYGFLDVALKNFKSHGMMDDKKYNMLSQELRKNALIKSEKGIQGLENYILSKKEEPVYQKTAAGIFLVFGIALLALTGVNITGNAVGNITPATSGLISVVLILISLSLFFMFRKHSK